MKKQQKQQIVIGKFRLARDRNGDYWLADEDAHEGMQTSEEKLEAMLLEFWEKES